MPTSERRPLGKSSVGSIFAAFERTVLLFAKTRGVKQGFLFGIIYRGVNKGKKSCEIFALLTLSKSNIYFSKPNEFKRKVNSSVVYANNIIAATSECLKMKYLIWDHSIPMGILLMEH